MKAEMDCFARERKELSEQVRDLENQLEGLRSESVEEIAELAPEKKALQDRLCDAESRILQLETRQREELEKVVKEKDDLAERLKSADEKLKQYATENVTREEIRQSLEDEIIRLRQTVGQNEGEKQKKEERIAEYEERIHGMQARLEAYQEYIQQLNTQLREEMSRHAPLYGAGLDALSMKELETISHIHEEGLRQIHTIQQQRVGMHHSNGHVNDELRQTVGQTEGEEREKEERIAEYEERINGMQAQLEAYQEYIQQLNTQLREEMNRHAPLYGAGLDALSMTELETISRIHEEGLRQIHAIQQQRKGSPLSSPIMSPHMLPLHNQGLYPTAPPQVAAGLPPSVLPNGVGMHHSNRHVNGAMGPWFNHK